MQNRVRVSGKAIDDARAPWLRGSVNRGINHDRSTNNVGARDTSLKSAVERIAAIVAHDEKTVRRGGVGKHVLFSRERRAKQRRLTWLGGTQGVILAKAHSVDPHTAIVDVHHV